ncbi:MAG: polysaccharide pyruvyl transferase family protein [Desulfovibrionaceae bacterium]|nr:polysaccharide pyruvyl transferase family protein [Desulfovibrionaceae bacterium]
MKKVLLAGASTYGVKNMGDDAMLDNLTQTLHERIDREIVFLARHPQGGYDEEYGIRSIKNFEHDSREQSLGRYFYGFNRGDGRNHLDAIREEMAGCDIVVIGGNSFMEVSASSFLRGVVSYSSLVATLAIFMNKPYVLYGVHGHPPKLEITAQMARFLCSNAALVTCREQFYKGVLADLGATGEHIQVFGDPAYGIDPVQDPELGRAILREQGIAFGRKNVVGVSFRHMYWVWDEPEFARLAEKMAQFCDRLVEVLDADLLVIPNCTYNIDNINEDDRYVAKVFMDKMRHRADIHLVDRDMSLTETLSLYRGIDMIVSNRRHACIFGAVYDKPVHALSTGHPWQFKPFVEDLGLTGCYSSFTEDGVEELARAVRTTWENRERHAASLAQTMPRLRERAKSQVDAIIAIMNAKKGEEKVPPAAHP